MYNNSSVIGNIGEAIAFSEFVKRGYTVLFPFGQNTPYDLVVDIGGKLYKIQCKTTEKIHEESVMLFYSCRTNGFTGKHTTYTVDEIDYIFLYCIENGYMGLINVNEVPPQKIMIRLNPPKNFQTKNVRMAQDYLLDVQLKKINN